VSSANDFPLTAVNPSPGIPHAAWASLAQVTINVVARLLCPNKSPEIKTLEELLHKQVHQLEAQGPETQGGEGRPAPLVGDIERDSIDKNNSKALRRE
jgi:hypothetical protein